MLQEWTLGTGIFNPVVDLSNYAGQNIYIALRHFNCTDQFRLSIDDFTVREQTGANQVTINVEPNNPSYGTVAGAGIYTIGDSVTISATASTGYTFSKWVDDNNTILSTNNPYTFVAAANLNLTAIFLDESGTNYTITVNVNDSTMGTPVLDSLTFHLTINNPALGSITPAPGTYVVALYDSLVLVATPNAGANFDGWKVSVAGQTIGTAPVTPFVIPVNPNNILLTEMTVVAMFSDSTSAPDSLTIVINTADATMGTTNPAPGTYSFAVGSQHFVTAAPNPGYHILYWIESLEIAGMSESDTLYADTILVDVTPWMAGVVSSLTAYFEADSTPVEPCMTPTNLHASTCDAHSITIGWNTNGNATSWNIHYRVEGGEWNNASSTTNTYVINGLEAETVYEIEVQADCGNGNLSDWSAPIHISTTIEVGINSWLENSVSLYPNPAKEVVNVQ